MSKIRRDNISRAIVTLSPQEIFPPIFAVLFRYQWCDQRTAAYGRASARRSSVPSMLEQLGGASPLSSLMERRISEAQGRRREAGSEGSVEQNRDPMDKNRITRLVRADERAGNREVHTIKDLSSRFGGCAAKAVELTSGDLRRVSQSGLAGSREPVIAWQKSAEGIVAGRTRRRPERWKGG